MTGLLNRIANYFKEWDGVDETAPSMELTVRNLIYKEEFSMLTLENFSPMNRTKTIGNSMYRISNTEPTNGTGKWYIHETYNDGTDWNGNNAHHNSDLQTVIDIFNGITKEKEVVSLKS